MDFNRLQFNGADDLNWSNPFSLFFLFNFNVYNDYYLKYVKFEQSQEEHMSNFVPVRNRVRVLQWSYSELHSMLQNDC